MTTTTTTTGRRHGATSPPADALSPRDAESPSTHERDELTDTSSGRRRFLHRLRRRAREGVPRGRGDGGRGKTLLAERVKPRGLCGLLSRGGNPDCPDFAPPPPRVIVALSVCALSRRHDTRTVINEAVERPTIDDF